MYYTLTPDGKVQKANDLAEWSEWMIMQNHRRQIGLNTYVMPGVGRVDVSTVFTGTAPNDLGEPQVFESAAFHEGGMVESVRAATLQGAMENHLRFLHTYGHEPLPN